MLNLRGFTKLIILRGENGLLAVTAAALYKRVAEKLLVKVRVGKSIS